MTTDLIIKKAGMKDAADLERISVDTFTETFAAQNTKEDMELFLKECFNLLAIQNEIADPDTEYYMAFLGDKLAGYIKIRNASHKDIKSTNCLEIARIYVYEAFHGKKVGASLMQFVMDKARSNKTEAVWLGVWEFNPKAIRFYEQWGFKVFGKHIFRLGTDAQNDILMCKYLYEN